MQQGITNIIHVYIVSFTSLMTAARTFISCNTKTCSDPCNIFHVSFIIQYFINMCLHILHISYRESADKNLKIIIVSFQHTYIVVRTTSRHGMRSDIIIFSNEEYKSKIWIRFINCTDILFYCLTSSTRL